MRIRALTALGITAILLSGCGKEVGWGKNFFSTDGDTLCDPDKMLTWSWIQPDATLTRSVDLLFVVDSSLSLIAERGRVAKAIPKFIHELPAQADTRVAVMLGHGDTRWTGRLFSHRDTPSVVDTQSNSPTDAEILLSDRLGWPSMELGVGNGEMLLHSLQRSLEDDRFEEIQAQGFYRPDAALSIVFLNDENDVCFDPREHGYTGYPHYKKSFLGIENRAHQRFCRDSETGELTVSPESVLSRLQERLSTQKISLAGIVHADPARVNRLGEDSIGHGVLELVSKKRDGVIMDITERSYDEALSKLGSIVSQQLHLMTSFPLSGKKAFDPGTINVKVDGKPTSALFDSQKVQIQLAPENAGGARSRIEVQACAI